MTVTERESAQLLAAIGDVGGVYGVFEVFVALFGSYLSARLLGADVASSYFHRKKLKRERAKKKGKGGKGIEHVESMFSNI